jgi:hypothetical protein
MIPVGSIREAISSNPSCPFTIHLTVRSSYEIRQPDSVSIGPQDRSLVVRHDGGGVSVVETTLIAGVDPPTPGEAHE